MYDQGLILRHHAQMGIPRHAELPLRQGSPNLGELTTVRAWECLADSASCDCMTSLSQVKPGERRLKAAPRLSKCHAVFREKVAPYQSVGRSRRSCCVLEFGTGVGPCWLTFLLLLSYTK